MSALTLPTHSPARSSGHSSGQGRRSPNRQRLLARIALWTVVFPAAGLIIPRLLF